MISEMEVKAEVESIRHKVCINLMYSRSKAVIAGSDQPSVQNKGKQESV